MHKTEAGPVGANATVNVYFLGQIFVTKAGQMPFYNICHSHDRLGFLAETQIIFRTV